jgi:hypothetical protein
MLEKVGHIIDLLYQYVITPPPPKCDPVLAGFQTKRQCPNHACEDMCADSMFLSTIHCCDSLVVLVLHGVIATGSP